MKESKFFVFFKEWTTLMKKWVTFNYKRRFSIFLLLLIIFYYFFPYWIQVVVHKISEKMELVAQRIATSLKNTYLEEENLAKAIMSFVYYTNTNVYGKFPDIIPIFQNVVFTFRYPFICIRLTDFSDENWVLYNRCGACFEYSLLYRKLASTANLTVRSVHNPGEDHNWDEVLIDGKWVVVDPSIHMYNLSTDFYEKNWSKNISYVFALYPNGTREDITKRYTTTGKLVVKLGNPHYNEATIIYLLSLSLGKEHYTGIECKINTSDVCEFEVGGTIYKIVAVRDTGILKYSDEKIVEVKEGDVIEKEVYPDKVDLGRSIPFYSMPLFLSIVTWVVVGALITEIKIIKNIKN